MKNTHFTLALLTACAVLPASGLLAQSATPAPSATPSVSAPAGTTTATESEEEGGGKMRARLASLTPEERQKLRAANKAAMQDPNVQALKAEKGDKGHKREFMKARREAMIKADPSVAPILEKLKEERHPGKNL